MSEEKEFERHGVTLFNRQSVKTISDDVLQKVLHVTAAAYQELKQREGTLLSQLEEIEVTLIDDPAIARVHGEFFDDPTATDVITFDHGEILISVETAARQAKKFQSVFDKELALYAIHGLAHLSGYDDIDPTDRKIMHAAQDELLERLWKK